MLKDWCPPYSAYDLHNRAASTGRVKDGVGWRFAAADLGGRRYAEQLSCTYKLNSLLSCLRSDELLCHGIRVDASDVTVILEVDYLSQVTLTLVPGHFISNEQKSRIAARA